MGSVDPKPVHTPLVFALNGQRVELASVDPKTTLLSYIRTETRFKGPKRGCGEGGCGACLVILAKYNPDTKQVSERSVNACLVLLCSIDGCAITTSEGLGNQRDGFHAIQSRLSAFHASQCGYCTPGMTVAIYSHLKKSPCPTSAEIERAIQGNICRCTGYRPILDVCKSFAADVDVEDLGLNTCWAKKSDAAAEKLPVYDAARDPGFPEFLVAEVEARKRLDVAPGRSWVSVRSLQELGAAMDEMQGRKVKMIVGNTSSGYYKELASVDVLVDISKIPELLSISKTADSLEVGAATRISELMDYLAQYPDDNAVAWGLHRHLQRLAGPHVRNWGSVGGNLAMAQQFAFDSDLATILVGAGATVKTINAPSSSLPLEEFLASPHTLILSIFIPLGPAPATIFRSFRGAPRPYGNAVAYANAAFLVRYDGAVVESVRLAFGAFGTKHAVRAVKVEEALKGKALSLGLVKECVEVLKKEIVPVEGTSKREYRVSLMVGFLFDFLQSLVRKEETVTPTNLFPHVGKQNITISEDRYPLSQPTAKFMSQQQASGEAVYCDDIPSPPHCLYAAFVLSTKPYARIKGIDASAALESEGAVDFVSMKDIPKSGKNIGVYNPFTHDAEETLFAEDIVGYVGQPLGILVSDSYDHARLAAEKVRVDYDTTSVDPPVMNCHDAVAQGKTVPNFGPSPLDIVGNVETSIAEAELKLGGTVSTKSQNHFYMETQTTLAIPDEDDSMTIYTAAQGVDPVQQVVAKCLNLPINNVRVITRRLGGGFGGKAMRGIQISAAVALAAYKLKVPVRISLDRNTDMQMVGGRNPTHTTFTVAFTKAGKLTALKLRILLEAGWFPDVIPILPLLMSATLKKYDCGAFQVEYIVCRTNNVPKTSVRAPGHCEAGAIVDAIMNRVATYLGISGNQLRDVNLHTSESFGLLHGGVDVGFTLPAVWERAKLVSEVEERERAIVRWNEGSRWVKRGVAMVPSVYGVLQQPTAATVSLFLDGSVVVEVGGVEMGQGLYTKVRQAVAFALSPLWNQRKDVDLVSKIRVLQQDSFSLSNTFADGGSTTSEGSCAAASQACEVLVQRLLPVKAKLGDDVSWENLCLTAKQSFVDLQSHVLWTPSAQKQYVLFGTGVSEVEINVLTGETRILRSDLVYDAGQSLNAAVDVGQVEGAFVMGIGFYLTEDIERDNEGKLLSDGTWTYKPPTVDTIPQKLNVELFNSPEHKDRVFSSKAVGEPPLLMAGSVHAAIHHAVAAARGDYLGSKFAGPDAFEFDPPATIDKVKALCGLDNVERYLESQLQTSASTAPHGKLL